MSCKHSDYFGLFQGLRKYFQGFCIKIVEFLIQLPWLLTYIIHSGFISGYQNRYGDNLKPPTNVYHRMTA